MKPFLLVIILLICCPSVFPQADARSDKSGNGAPSGNCHVYASDYSQVYVDRTTGTSYHCIGTPGTSTGSWSSGSGGGGGGIGGTTGATDLAILQANGTGGSTIQASPATINHSTGDVATPGQLTTGNAGGVAGKVCLFGSTSGSGCITVASVAGAPSDVTLPTTSGSSGLPLTTNGSGVTGWNLLGVLGGGTGQSTYTKGDLLVTPGSTTLNKLAVGSDGQVLTADSASTNGVKWAAGGGGTSFDPLDVTTLYFRDDFLSGNQSSGSIGYGWIVVNDVGTLTTSILEGTYPRFGQIQIDTSGVSGDGGSFGLSSTNGVLNKLGNLSANTNWDSYWIVALNQTTSIKARFGLCFQNALRVPTDGLFIGYDTSLSDSNFTFETRASSTSTRTASAVAADTSFHKLRIRSTVAGSIKFSIDGGAETTISTNVPTANLTPCTAMATITGSARSVKLDFFSFLMTGLSR